MSDPKTLNIAIVDYGMGNLFSVKHMCDHIGIQAKITSLKQEIQAADAVILPGVGAFGDAMDTLRRLDLVTVLKDIALSHKPLFGICLGMQLLMSESYEFGRHKGLGIIKGPVVQLNNPVSEYVKLKVPHVGWNRIWWSKRTSTQPRNEDPRSDSWSKSFFEGLQEGVFMYFIHSFYAKPDDPTIVQSITRYGNIEFCSSFQYKNIFACQFHPERSGPQGMVLYRNLASFIERLLKGKK